MFKAFCAMLLMLCLLPGVIVPARGQTSNDITTVIIMRHAEKANGKDPDPELSAAGIQRAERLATLLKDVPVTHLMATPYKRTQHTLAALATAKELSVESYDPGKQAELVKTLQAAKGQTFVIAGHANTAPELVNLLLNDKKYTQLAEDEFGKIWIITLRSGKAMSCMVLNTN